jgi:U3 small nucleolar RNA-associated protein 10
MIPYMSFLLEPFIATLQAFSDGTVDNQKFWTCILETLTKSLSFDDGG